MTDVLNEEPAEATSDQEISAHKRRKVRKGTRSCWECKRRKMRCIFPSSEDAICVGCKRRRAPCVSQDMPEDSSPATKGNRHLGERIAKVEDVVRDFLATQQVGATGPIGEPRQERQHSNPDALHRARDYDLPAPSSTRAPLTPAETLAEPTPKSTLLPLDAQQVSGQTETKTAALRHLLAALPAEEDVRILLRESARTSLYTSVINTQPHSKLTLEALAPPYPLPEYPGPNLHPVVLAKYMLMFAIALQSPSGERFLGQISEPPSVLSRRLVAAASTWVTTKEEMFGTVESLLCIILEGVFKVNCGNLRQAWAVYRRAMTVAQMMGLHRSIMPPLQRIDPELVADPEFIWFRIVYMDRYLSLLLGLPQGTSDTSMGAMSVLQHEPPSGRFERQLTLIASCILQRNESAFASNDITTTQSIDLDLLKVSKSMPASFWRPVDFHNLIPGSPENLLEAVRLAAQVYYYGLLLQLHLPYMMHGESDAGERDYSKFTCVNAGREILTRFIAHRDFRPTASCSRPVDFFALLAAMTLLLAHLDAHHNHHHHHHRPATNFLAHQRLSDRAMLDQALDRMDVFSNVCKDPISEQSAKLIRRLLDVEADAAEGSSYTARSVRGDEDDTPDDTEKEGAELRLHIPYLGVIKIARQNPISREQPTLGDATSRPLPLNIQVDFLQRAPTLVSSSDTPTALSRVLAVAEQHQPLDHLGGMVQGFATSLDYLPASERPSMQLNAPPTGYDGQATYMLQYCDSSGQGDITLQPHMGLPCITAGANDWAFQGVDMAFVDNLMRGASCPDAFRLEQ